MTIDNLPHTRKSLGQHWLSDDSTLNAICEAGKINQDDVVLEIGPGIGTLTSKLVKKAGRVIAVELDGRLARELSERVSDHNLEVVQGDILKFDLTTLSTAYKVIANIPYYLTSKLLRVLSESANPPNLCVLLVQKEVAERVAAGAGGMSLLSVTAQYYWEVRTGQVVNRKMFTPPPKVDSQILILQKRSHPLFDADAKKFFRLVKAGFASRRKTLLNSLSAGLGVGKVETIKLLEAARVSPQIRPQELTLENWYEIYKRALPLF